MNLERNKSLFTWMFYALFTACFSLITVNTIFNNTYHDTAYLLPVTFVCFSGLIVIFKVLAHFEDKLQKYYNIILAAFCLTMLIVQIITGNILRFQPVYDVGAVYHGAVEWTTKGTFEGYYDYFEWFPNNLGAMTFLFVFFKLGSVFGITDFFMVAVTVNSILSVCMMATVSLICKRLKGVKYGLFALCLFALSLPFYIMGAAFYTDALSMLFPVLFYYLYLRSKDEKITKRRIIYYLLMGAVGAIGMQIKFTVLIGVIAVMIDMLFNCRFRHFICAAGCSAIIIFAVSITVSGIIYSNHLDREIAEKKNTPYSHWIMMGLHGNGFYNPQDYEFTRSFENTEERNSAIFKEISRRISERKYKGMFDLFLGKLTTDFGDGTYGLADCVSAPHGENKPLHEYVIYSGQKYKGYSHYCTSMQIALLSIMLFGAYCALSGKKKTSQQELAPFVAVFGIMLFLMLWETNRRYFSNFIPMIFICAVLNIEHIADTVKERCGFLKQALK